MPLRLVLLLTVALPSFAQRFEWRGTLVNRQNPTEPVPFATVVVSGKNRFFTADETGRVVVFYETYDASDSLRLACVGYEAVSVSCRELLENRPGTLAMEPVATLLKEVRVSPRPERRSWVGSLHRTTNHTVGEGPGSESALLILPTSAGSGVIGKVRYYLLNMGNRGERVPFRVRLYGLNPQTGGPGADLLPEVIIAQATREGWLVVDIAQYRIRVPEGGFFVGMQTFSEAEYPYEKESVRARGPNGRMRFQLAVYPHVGTTNEFGGEKRSWVKNSETRSLNGGAVPEFFKNWRSTAPFGNRNYMMAAEIELD